MTMMMMMMMMMMMRIAVVVMMMMMMKRRKRVVVVLCRISTSRGKAPTNEAYNCRIKLHLLEDPAQCGHASLVNNRKPETEAVRLTYRQTKLEGREGSEKEIRRWS
ncbi:hypothetical protein ElyMa_000391200 [Elysia marginata]|uniref:Secreted protein n=1 Tax=Elysia marginata TaxID=1093978 RepID=A0AAV4FI38_9GAST|nr:hypothetical protein ElyMa_000391200 [Elysia marginata]